MNEKIKTMLKKGLAQASEVDMKKVARKGLEKSIIVNAKGGASARNFYTGKQFSPVLAPTIAVGSVLAAGGLGKNPDQPETAREITPFNALSLTRTNAPPALEQTANPYTLADGTAGVAPTLGTNGSMVFGMHNQKQGGYL